MERSFSVRELVLSLVSLFVVSRCWFQDQVLLIIFPDKDEIVKLNSLISPSS